jgi:hypothetical protein
LCSTGVGSRKTSVSSNYRYGSSGTEKSARSQK